jgi:hypothetical protein
MVSDIDVLMAEPAPMDRLRAYDCCRVRHLLGKCRGEILYDGALDREEGSGSFSVLIFISSDITELL